MSPIALVSQATELLAKARESRAGRAAELVVGGPGSTMTHTVIALTDESELHEHSNPGEASLLVLEGKVQLRYGEDRVDAGTGELVPIPDEPHSVLALADSTVLLTAVKLPTRE